MKRIIFILVFSVLLVACDDETENKNLQDSDEKNVEAVNKDHNDGQESEEFENTFPFTGIGTNESIDHRAVGVMINNHGSARPQTGLSQADLIFEMLAEGMITRFLAIYHSEHPEVVGPVRSAREYYFDLANRYGALYIYHGAATFVNEMLDNRGIDHLDGANYDNDGELFKRESFRVAPHNSYLLFGNVRNVATDIGYNMSATHKPMTFLSEEEIETLEGDSANHVEIVYSQEPMEIVEYHYEADSERYTRYNDREKTVELETGEPVQVDNIFIVETHHEIIDDAGRRAIDFYTGGDAYLIQKGKVQQLKWENRSGQIVPVKDGKVVGFVPGKTWINVVPTSPGMKKSVMITGE